MKRLVILNILLIMANAVFAQESEPYDIGNIGPGGGLIFYIQGDTYLECSEVLEGETWFEAMALAEDYRGGGYDDWYLPNKDKLNYIYENLRVKGFISDDGWFWSSSQYNNAFAWTQSFSDGNQYHGYYYGELNLNYVYAVRSFYLY